jgi:predicted dienelactone hydrolase
VVSADHPGTRRGAAGGPEIGDVADQPRDVSAIIDRLAHQTAPGGSLDGLLDLDRIAVVGHSLGGLTATLAAYHPRLRDPRIGVAISISGPFAFFTRRFFEHAELPFLMIAGRADVVVDYEENARPVLERVPGSSLLSIADASHAGFDDKASSLRLFANPDRIGCIALSRYLVPSENEELVHRLGGSEVGIELPETARQPCERTPPRGAMDPVQQQLITQLAVAAFLDANFSPDLGAQIEAAQYLEIGLSYDFPTVTFEGGGFAFDPDAVAQAERPRRPSSTPP